MKFMKNIFVLLAVAAAVLGCRGTIDDSTLPVLTASTEEVDLASGESVEFTVTYAGRDVTAESVISIAEWPASKAGNIFTPEKQGGYTAWAEYAGKQSNEVSFKVVNSNVSVESKYEKHVSIIEFTGAGCTFCPAGYDRMVMIMNGPSYSKYQDRIHVSAFHSSDLGKDAMEIPATADLFDMFRKTGNLALPSFVCDLRYAGNLAQEVISYFKESLTMALNTEPHCGVAVSSSVNEVKSEASVSVKVASELTSEYRVVLLVVEDKVLAPDTPQKSPLYPEGNPDHIHKHVVRQVATSYTGTFTGEKITDDGKISAGQEASKTWTVSLDPSWKLDDTEIYAIVLDKDGFVNNMNVCHIKDGNSDYKLKK